VRHLLVNADDFGMSPGVNRGIAAAHENGIVKNASLMVRFPAAAAAAAYAREHPDLSVGLHIDLGEWVSAGDDWVPLYTVIPVDDRGAAEDEIARQLATFRELLGHDPTHLDSHQHVHLEEPVRSIAVALAAELGVPLRRCDPRIQYCGSFYGQIGHGETWLQGVSVTNLLAILADLPPGVTEICCHPGFDDGLATPYRLEREHEVRALCDPRVRSALQTHGIELARFDSWSDAAGGESG